MHVVLMDDIFEFRIDKDCIVVVRDMITTSSFLLMFRYLLKSSIYQRPRHDHYYERMMPIEGLV